MHHWLRKALDAPMIQQNHGVALSRRSRNGCVPGGNPTPDNVRDRDYLADRYP